VKVAGCGVEPEVTGIQWNGRLKSTSHLVRIPADFASESFTCTVEVEAEARVRPLFSCAFEILRGTSSSNKSIYFTSDPPPLAELSASVVALGVGIGGVAPRDTRAAFQMNA